jgi:transglutaminase-like putative cysteine protease
MNAIHAEFDYDAEATEAETPPAEAFRARRGVCQDFAHIMIIGLRAYGIPAAYVSGYLRTIPPPGKERLVGADATHAWVNLWCGDEIGWIGLDPTNALVAGEDHIFTAMGRDYGDVAPVDGVFLGGRGQEMEVSVDVAPRVEMRAVVG